MERYTDNHIENLKIKLCKMSSLVDEQLQWAVRSVEEEDPKLSKLVIDRDDIVDSYEIKIEKICQMIFALTQPVAMDLRYVMSALKININLERIGDLASNIARANLELGSRPDYYSQANLPQIAAFLKEQVKDAIDAVIEADINLANRVLKREDKIEELVKESTLLLEEIMAHNSGEIKKTLLLYKILLNLERLNDHAMNIGEEVYFIVSGKSIKHSNEI